MARNPRPINLDYSQTFDRKTQYGKARDPNKAAHVHDHVHVHVPTVAVRPQPNLPRRHDDTKLFNYVITFVASCLRGSFKKLHKSG